MRPGQPAKRLTAAHRRRFLTRLAEGWSITKAAADAGFSRQRFYDLKATSPTFAAEWQDAYEQGVDVLRDEIRRRGVDGWDEPVFQRGEQVGLIRRFSDQLLMFEAKRRDPAYRDASKVELTGAGGGPVVTEDRSASLADIVSVLRKSGALDDD